MTLSPITFRPVTRDDFPLLLDWLRRPHVAAWWSPTPGPAEIEADFGPSVDGTSPVRCYIAMQDDVAIGYIQSYRPVECHVDGWWLDEHDPGVVGIDQFLADGTRLGVGIGTAMIQAFIARLFADASVSRIQTDPDPCNARAVRCYEKVGFTPARESITPDGHALLMYCERPADVSP